jgi:ribosome-associated translation inhibitor RaiA
MDPRITWRNVEPMPAIAERVRQRARSLEKFHDRIEGCDVMVEAPQKPRRSGRIFHVRVNLHVPGPDLSTDVRVAQGSARDDATLAVNRAFSAMEKRLKAQKRRMTGHGEKRHDPVLHGVIETFEPELGWGMLRADDGREVYFEKDSLTAGDWGALARGQRLRFRERAGARGPFATGVSPAD